jgi:tetratricopeptide (TPR) repeat protein
MLAAVWLWASAAMADDYRSKINEGFDYYKNGEYDKAHEQFKEAGILKPDQALPAYDKGTALYRSKNFEGAAGEFESSVSKNDPKLRADAFYNAGNAYLKSERYDQAVKSYVDALKIRPKERDYKHNLELALRQMKQQQRQQNQSNSDKQDKKNQKQDQQQNKQENQQQNQQSSQQQDHKQDQEKKGQTSQQNQQMTEEQAQELLARFANDEKDTQKRLKQANIRGHSINDW